MSTNGISSISRVNDNPYSAYSTTSGATPTSSDVQAFNQTLSGADTAANSSYATDTSGASQSPTASSNSSSTGTDSQQALQQIVGLIAELIQSLLSTIQQSISGGSTSGQDNSSAANSTGGCSGSSGSGTCQGGSTPNGEGGGISPVNGNGPGGSAGSDQLIPAPTDNIQKFNLGNKPVTIGGDGSATPAEVQATAKQLQNLYKTSPTFKNMIDSSSDPSFQVTVGKRADNTSWGNSQGRVFMNINNIAPTNQDTFQSLMGHEFAHASIDLGHGAQMQQVEQAVAQEAA